MSQYKTRPTVTYTQIALLHCLLVIDCVLSQVRCIPGTLLNKEFNRELRMFWFGPWGGSYMQRLTDQNQDVRSQTGGALQIQDRSPQSRPVASRNQSQTHSDATGLDCGDRSWICNMLLIRNSVQLETGHHLPKI